MNVPEFSYVIQTQNCTPKYILMEEQKDFYLKREQKYD